MDQLVARQRDAALKQATTQLSAERNATILQLNSTVTSQQDLMTRNLQRVTDESIDRLFQRVRSLVLIAVVAVLAAILVHRGLRLPRGKSSSAQ
jgi:hypothetical protein